MLVDLLLRENKWLREMKRQHIDKKYNERVTEIESWPVWKQHAISYSKNQKEGSKNERRN